MIDQIVDVSIVLAIYIPGIALLVWAVDESIEALARRTQQRRQRTSGPSRTRRAPAADQLPWVDAPHLEKSVIAGVVTPADLITGAPRQAGHHNHNVAA